MRVTWKKVGGFVAAASTATAVAFVGTAHAAELVTAEVSGTANDVTVTQGSSTDATVNLTATGSISCSITSANASTATVDTSFSIGGTGTVTASAPSSARKFYSDGVVSGGNNCGITWDGAPTPYSVTANFSAAASTPVGDYSVTLSAASLSNPSAQGGKLGDTTATTVTVHVVAPVVTNHAPTVQTAAADAVGNEGDTLTTSGSFQDVDGNTLSLSATGAGSFVDNGDGTWSWSLATSDDTSGNVSVTASDGHGGTVSDSFGYSAVNVAPTDPGVPGLTSGSSPNSDGVFTLGWNASSDVAADTVTYTLQHKDANDPSWSTVASGVNTNSYALTSEGEGTWTYRVQATDGELTNADSGWSAASGAVVVDASVPNAPTLTPPAAIYSDATGDWYDGPVSIDVTDNGDPALADGSAGSGVDPSSFLTPMIAGAEGANLVSATVKDYAGNESAPSSLTVYVDTTAPAVTLTCPAATLTLGSSVTAAWSASDGSGSGVATGRATGSINAPTGSLGTHVLTVPDGASLDNVGNASVGSNQCSYTVVYKWSGFFAPVDNVPTLNSVKAGSAVPVKFNLAGDQGLGVLLTGTGKTGSAPIACDATDPVDPIEATVSAGNSSLSYDATTGQYTYVWKTDKSWTGCRQLTVVLDDGTTHKANFKFTK